MATFPDLTASMISSSLVSRVPPWNTTLRAPPERLVSSSDIHLKATALDSGGAVMWGKSSFFAPGLAWPEAGLCPPERATATTSRSTATAPKRSEEHTSELQSLRQLVCRLLLEKKKTSASTAAM